MKRPFCLFTLIALSGILCGLLETDVRWKLAAMAGLAALCLRLKENGGPVKRRLFFCILGLLAFSAGFLRAETLSSRWNRGETAAFFAEKAPRNPGEFDYALYLKSQGISSEESLAENRDGKTRDGKQSLLTSVREHAAEILQTSMTERDAGMYQAILLGDKSKLEADTKRLYQRAGISHVIAISGLHLSVIGLGLFKLLRCLPLGIGAAGILTSFFIFAYGLMTGASGSAMRAVIMLMLRFCALRAGRCYDMRTAVAVAALLLAFARPYLLLQSGFLLSFGAVLGICVAADEISKGLGLRKKQAEKGKEAERRKQEKLGRQKNRKNREKQENRKKQGKQATLGRSRFGEATGRMLWQTLCQMLLLDFCIQLCTLPILLSSYYTVPLYGFLFNLLVIPLMTVVLCSGIFALLLGLAGQLLSMISGMLLSGPLPVLASLASAPGHYIFNFYEWLCHLNQNLPFHSLVFGKPGPLQCLLYCGLLSLLIWHYFVRTSRKPTLAGIHFGGRMSADVDESVLNSLRSAKPFCLLLLLPFVLLHPRELQKNTVQLTALDVGQGDGFVLRHGGQTILIDGGSSSNKRLGERVLEPFLLSQGIRRIDLAFVSHSDADHISGLLYLFQTDTPIHINKLVLPEAARSQPSYDTLKSAYLAKMPEGKIAYLGVGDCICGEEASGLHLCCIDAGDDSVKVDVNSHSPTMLLRYGNFAMLFTGDMAQADEQRLYRSLSAELQHNSQRPMPGHRKLPLIYKSAHHGSKTSNSDSILKLFCPDYALLSYGEGNRYGHPSPEVLRRFRHYGVELLETARSGAITFTTDGRRLRCSGFMKSISTTS